ncbi:hypothetical protein [Argonema galeatum]|uniref:hypothetical protein n=1 Tax=Argonema galeatum TaxID=2942762 RepID=UPI002012AD4A|nr:hypothetical protein [Argonema galeatum]MCL1467225.1 hypothetical protein [Argonema galeatum A003/A1]
MKKKLELLATGTLLPLTIAIAGVSLTEVAEAAPTVNAATNRPRSCTASTCTAYRANYERAIATRIISRPSLVADENLAIALADRAMAKGDRNEAARRLAQALVIVSESKKPGQGIAGALAIERSLDADMKKKRGQSLRVFLPLFDRIFPQNKDPYS